MDTQTVIQAQTLTPTQISSTIYTIMKWLRKRYFLVFTHKPTFKVRHRKRKLYQKQEIKRTKIKKIKEERREKSVRLFS